MHQLKKKAKDTEEWITDGDGMEWRHSPNGMIG